MKLNILPLHALRFFTIRDDVAGVLSRRQRAPNPLQQLPRAVLVAPAVDVIPIQRIALYGNHILYIFNVLLPLPFFGPSELGDDDVLRRRQPHWLVRYLALATSLKALLVVRIFTQDE